MLSSSNFQLSQLESQLSPSVMSICYRGKCSTESINIGTLIQSRVRCVLLAMKAIGCEGGLGLVRDAKRNWVSPKSAWWLTESQYKVDIFCSLCLRSDECNFNILHFYLLYYFIFTVIKHWKTPSHIMHRNGASHITQICVQFHFESLNVYQKLIFVFGTGN